MIDQGYLHLRSSNFAKTPAELIHSAAITDGAYRLYGHMRWRYGDDMQNREGRASMSSMLGVSETTITNRAHELEQADWIVVIPRMTANGRKSNVYHVFEDQDDCRAYRIENKCEKPAIDNLRQRKSRAGAGGRPSHKAKLKLDEPTKLEFDNQPPKETQVEGGQKLEFAAPLNSSLPPVSRVSSDQDLRIPYGLLYMPLPTEHEKVVELKAEPPAPEPNPVQESEIPPKVPAKGSLADLTHTFAAQLQAKQAAEDEVAQRGGPKVTVYKWVSGHIHNNPRYVFTGFPVKEWRIEPSIWTCRLDRNAEITYAEAQRQARDLILNAPDDLLSRLHELDGKELVFRGGTAEHGWTYSLAYFVSLSPKELAALRKPAPLSLPGGEEAKVRKFTPSPAAERGLGGEVDMITLYGKRGSTYHVARRGEERTLGDESIGNLIEKPNEGTKYHLCAKCDRALHPPKPRPEVPIISAYHYSLPESHRPARAAFSQANIDDALALVERGITADDVGRYVTETFEGYLAWARADPTRPTLMSFKHVANRIAAWLSEHPKPSDQMESKANEPATSTHPVLPARRIADDDGYVPSIIPAFADNPRPATVQDLQRYLVGGPRRTGGAS